mgnify:CR=1 FL=1
MSEPLHVLGLAGSPRRQGNTEILLDQFLSAPPGFLAQRVVDRLQLLTHFTVRINWPSSTPSLSCTSQCR